MLESGIDITTALELLRGQIANHTLVDVLGDVISELRNGNQLSMALGKHPRIFAAIHCRSLRVGEQTGGLEVMLRQIADYMEKEIAAAKGIKSALTQPVIAAVATVVVVGVLITFVLPAFGDLYSSLGADLPALTRILISTSTWFQSNVLYIFIVLLFIAGLAYSYIRTPNGKYKLHKLAFTIPLIGRVNHLKELARNCRSISLLFHAGLPLTEIMPLIIEGVNNKVMVEALSEVQRDMLKGEGLSKPMSKNRFFLPMMVQMVKVGEETGNLDTTLLAVAQSYETEARDKTDSLTGMIQPTMMLIIGGVIGMVALSMLSAMYSIYGQVL